MARLEILNVDRRTQLSGGTRFGTERLCPIEEMSGKLTKAELSKEIARNCESSLKEGREILELILNAMTRALSRGERVEIRGFGSFATRVRNPRIGRNPKTGATVNVPPKRVPYFRASKELRTLL